MTLSLAQNPILPTVGAATLNAGFAGFNGVDDTLAERLSAVAAGIAQGFGGVPAGGEVAVFEFDRDSYLLISNNAAPVDTTDTLVRLTGASPT